MNLQRLADSHFFVPLGFNRLRNCLNLELESKIMNFKQFQKFTLNSVTFEYVENRLVPAG